MFATKYIEFNDGTIVMFSNHMIHKDMANAFAQHGHGYAVSAGFVNVLRDGMKVYGESISLNIRCNPALDLNTQTYHGAVLDDGFSFILSNNTKLFESLGLACEEAPFKEIDDGYGTVFRVPAGKSFHDSISRQMLP